MVTVSVNESPEHHPLPSLCLSLCSTLPSPPATPGPFATSVHGLHHPHRPLPGVEDAHGGLGHLALQLVGGGLTQAPLSILLLQPVIKTLNHGSKGFHVSRSHCRDLGSTGRHTFRPVLGGACLGRVEPGLAECFDDRLAT